MEDVYVFQFIYKVENAVKNHYLLDSRSFKEKEIRMLKYLFVLIFSSIVLPVFAHDALSSKNCDPIANACLKAGFSESGTYGKSVWYDCMKPILLGRNVTDVTVDSVDVHACRQFKIEDLKELLKDL